MATTNAQSSDKNIPAISAETTAGGDGVVGKGDSGGRGIVGLSDTFQGVFGHSNTQAGVVGESNGFDGVFGISHSKAAGVSGHNDAGGVGVFAESKGGRGVAGFSDSWQGVFGHSNTQAGVVGESDGFDGVFGISHNAKAAGVSGHNPGGLAGFFDGNVEVTGDIRLVNADCAEDFDIADFGHVEPGTVMILEDEGLLRASQRAYDKRVVGVLSGAGGYKPGLTLDKQESSRKRLPVALLGKVYCKVDAGDLPIEVGDLLTTSPTPGHAMKAADSLKAFGCVIGKALRSQPAGRGLIPILVALQ